MATRATRRAFLRISALIGTGTLSVGGRAVPFESLALQEASEPAGVAVGPAWRFIVYQFEDPYSRAILRPEAPEPGMRYVGADVEINNDSDAPLDFAPSGVRLRDADGFEHSSGAVRGSDPRILEINLIPGERARGWVWFSVPEATRLVDLTYEAPSPRLTVPLSMLSSLNPEGTPLPVPPGFPGSRTALST